MGCASSRPPDDVSAAQVQVLVSSWDKHEPFFYFVRRTTVLSCTTPSLPRMQELRDGGKLTKIHVSLTAAFRGEGIIKSILFVSHRWEEKESPDIQGAQLKALQEYLWDHPEAEYIWFDYSCMPQWHAGKDGKNGRTPAEDREFEHMLGAIADLYLTARVLILLDGSYASRFW